MVKESIESKSDNVMSMHLLPKSIEAEKDETEYEKKQRVGVPSYPVHQLMKECEVDFQWIHVRHVPQCESLCWLKPHKDKAEGKEEYGDQNDKKKPWSTKFETTDSSKYRLITADRCYVGKTSDKKGLEQQW